MRLISLLTVIVLAPTTVLAVANATFVAQQITQISPCGVSICTLNVCPKDLVRPDDEQLKCLAVTIPRVKCALLDTTCQCASSKLPSITANCMYANCTYPETLELSRIQANICERPYESQNYKIRVMTIVGCVITTSAVFLRLISKYVLNHQFGLDDLFVILALVTHTFFTAFGVKLEQHGFGNHVWTIHLTDIQNLFLWFYICEFLYILTIGFVKISLLFFYLRVFPKRSLRVCCYLTGLFCVLGMIAFILVTIFQCSPVKYVWDKTIPNGQCINYNAVAWTHAAINILQDFIIVILPIRETMKLQLSMKQKIRLVSMFCVGGFVCVASLIRLESLLTFGLTADPTWDNIPITFWSTLETTAAIVCVCMPAIRAGIVYVFPFLSSTKRRMNTAMGTARSKAGNVPETGKPLESATVDKTYNSKRKPPFVTEYGAGTRSYVAPIEISEMKSRAQMADEPLYSSKKNSVSLPSLDREKPLPMIPESSKDFI